MRPAVPAGHRRAPAPRWCRGPGKAAGLAGGAGGGRGWQWAGLAVGRAGGDNVTSLFACEAIACDSLQSEVWWW